MREEEDVGLDRSAASSRVCAFVYAAVDFYKTSLSLPQRAPRQEEKVLQHFIPLFFFFVLFLFKHPDADAGSMDTVVKVTGT